MSSSSIKNTQLDGDFALGRHLAMGGDLSVAGEVHIGHDLHVHGTLDADIVNGAIKGVFLTFEELEEAYPSPKDGWLAGIGSSAPFAAYLGRNGHWVSTGGTIYGIIEGSSTFDGDYDFVRNVIHEEGDNRYLRKDTRDVASDHETFNGGIAVTGRSELNGDASVAGELTTGGNATVGGELSAGGAARLRTVYFGDYTPGLIAGASSGAVVEESGAARFKSVSISEFLEVPELRYNRALVTIGIGLRSEGGGIIETVSPTSYGGVIQPIGWATLKLEDGEYGAIMVGDLLLGFWHNEDGGNADTTTDSRNGDYTLAGFTAVYFEIVSIDNTDGRNRRFQYQLRCASDNNWSVRAHPFAGMHFAGIGHRNSANPTRQQLVVDTTTYSLRLTGLDDWNYTSSNIYEIHGLLDGFSMRAVGDDGQIYTRSFSGYGQVFGNAYVFGRIELFEREVYVMHIDQSLNGSMAPGETETVTCQILDVLFFFVIN